MKTLFWMTLRDVQERLKDGGDARERVFEVLHASVEISAGFIELMW
ncbi:hypothetical protein PMIT1342_02136 [Prochlorococcus marinus str. MIT 1342]|nr:hypothetical protein PMIT1342_02136 [Prochlorococcus marinus str. MIT 1342]